MLLTSLRYQQPELVVDGLGVVRDCSVAGAAIFGYRPDDLRGRPVEAVLPRLAGKAGLLHGQPDARLHFLAAIGYRFQAIRRDGGRFLCQLALHALENPPRLRLLLRRC